jgi:hypothetical protein
MPYGLQVLFDGSTSWKVPSDFQMTVGPTKILPLPRNYMQAWREVEVEDPLALAAILPEVGADTTTFWRYVADEAAEAKPRLKACFAEAERDQVFGVRTSVI